MKTLTMREAAQVSGGTLMGSTMQATRGVMDRERALSQAERGKAASAESADGPVPDPYHVLPDQPPNTPCQDHICRFVQ